jgi:hypothetical protein
LNWCLTLLLLMYLAELLLILLCFAQLNIVSVSRAEKAI